MGDIVMTLHQIMYLAESNIYNCNNRVKISLNHIMPVIFFQLKDNFDT